MQKSTRLNKAYREISNIIAEYGRQQYQESSDLAVQAFNRSQSELFKAFQAHGMAEDTVRLNWLITTCYNLAIPPEALRARKVAFLIDGVDWPSGVRTAIDDDMKSYRDFGDDPTET